jgi:pilus assembly protein Flp/PilA
MSRSKATLKVYEPEDWFTDIWETHMLHYTRMRIQSLSRTERGASAVEYGLLVALIAVAIIVAVAALGGTISDMFTDTGDCIENPDRPKCD